MDWLDPGRFLGSLSYGICRPLLDATRLLAHRGQLKRVCSNGSNIGASRLPFETGRSLNATFLYTIFLHIGNEWRLT